MTMPTRQRSRDTAMSHARSIALIVSLASFTASTASAQTPPAAPTTDDVARCTPVAADTVAGFVYGSLVPDAAGIPADPARFTRVLGRLAAALMDDTLTLQPVARNSDIVVTAVTSRRDPRPRLLPRWPGHPALLTEVAFTLEPSGALAEPRVIVRGDSQIASTLLRAIERSAQATGDSASSGRQRVRLRLSLASDSQAVAMPFVAARQLVLPGTAPQWRPGLSAPRHPGLGSRRRLTASVVAWYTVDAGGRVVPSSFGAAPAADPTQAGSYEPFIEAVRQAALKAPHEPGTAGGCPAARQSIIEVVFNVEGDVR